MTIVGKVHSISLGGIDLSSFVKDIGIELDPWQESMLAGLPDATFRFGGFWQPRSSITWACTWDDLHPETQAYFRRLFAESRRRRLSRMRTAYRKKHRR